MIEGADSSARGELVESRTALLALRRAQGERSDSTRHSSLSTNPSMAAALVTAISLSLGGLVTAVVLGLTTATEADILRHTALGIFATMLTLLSHSMMMFYLIGKGRAVREAVTEGRLAGNHVRDVARLRKPVFSLASLAMALTMITAIGGASVDVRVMPAGVHAALAYSSLAVNLAALRAEVVALIASARIVDEVNRLLNA